MKSVCRFCNSSDLIRWAGRRRKCVSCGRTFRVAKAGRKRRKVVEMYLLDRSTFRRISAKVKRSHVETIRQLKSELKYLPAPLLFLKKIFIAVATFWSSMVNIFQLKEKNIVNI